MPPPPTPDLIHLYVLIEGKSSYFPVEIQSNKKVHDLKKLILEDAILDVPAYTLCMWKVDIELEPYRGHSDLLCYLKADENLLLEPRDTIAQCWPAGQPSLSCLHVIVQREATTVQETQTKRYRKGANPSTVCRDSKAMEKRQNTAEILNGRPWTLSGPPVGLYHSVFDTFCDDLSDLDNPPQYRTATSAGDDNQLPSIDDAFSFLRASSKYYVAKQSGKIEDERLIGRKEAIMPILSRLLGIHLYQVKNSDLTEPDALATISAPEGRAGVAIVVELKLESGVGGDAITQTQQSYARTWSLPEYDGIRSTSCCPSFLVAIAGPWITVFGAVYVQKVIVQRLAGPIYLSPQPLHPFETIQSPLRLFYALRRGIQALQEYYQQLPATTTLSRFFPHIRSFQFPSGPVGLTYLSLLSNESRAVYLAELDDGTRVVVKFVSTYNVRAHNLLAADNLAPKLLYDGTEKPRHGNLAVIIMEYVEGETLEEHLCNLRGSPGIAAIVIESLNKALQQLHAENLVFGDLRTPNILLGKDGKIRLIDFDWCGVHEQQKYPFIIGNGIEWATGVGPMAIMNKNHDLFLLATLETHLRAGDVPGTW